MLMTMMATEGITMMTVAMAMMLVTDGNYDDDHRKHRVKHCSILVLLPHVGKTAVTL